MGICGKWRTSPVLRRWAKAVSLQASQELTCNALRPLRENAINQTVNSKSKGARDELSRILFRQIS
jgi:hypothetical protein